MLDERRVQEAVQNVKRYLSDDLLKKEKFQKVVFDTYMRNHQESLDLAEHIFSTNRSNLWTIVISYYSMFYIANAVLYSLGYKVGDKIAHKITADALITVVRTKLKASLLEEFETAQEEASLIAGTKTDLLIGSFDAEREKRSFFQYTTTEEIKSARAKTSFERARVFATEMRKLLSDVPKR